MKGAFFGVFGSMYLLMLCIRRYTEAFSRFLGSLVKRGISGAFTLCVISVITPPEPLVFLISLFYDMKRLCLHTSPPSYVQCILGW